MQSNLIRFLSFRVDLISSSTGYIWLYNTMQAASQL